MLAAVDTIGRLPDFYFQAVRSPNGCGSGSPAVDPAGRREDQWPIRSSSRCVVWRRDNWTPASVPALADSWTWERDSIGGRVSPEPAGALARRRARSRVGRAVHVRPLRGSDRRLARAASLARIDSVTRARFRHRRILVQRPVPEQFYDAGTRMLIVPEHLSRSVPCHAADFDIRARPVGSARFRLAKWTTRPSSSLQTRRISRPTKARPRDLRQGGRP